MKAALLTQLDSPLTLGDVELTPLSYGQVKVRILASGICGAQLAEIRGEKGNAGHLPHLLGHEGCAIVAEVGPAVTRVKVGEKVVCHWRKGEGLECPEFPKYLFRGKTITSGKVVTFAEEAIVSENRLTPVPQNTPNELCALLGCGLSTALGTIENEAELKFGENILIVGCGGLGINLILAAKVRGAGFIAVCDSRDKANLAMAMGASTFFRPTANITRLAYGGKQPKFDVIIDSAGAGDSMEATLPFLNSGGRFIMVGQPKPGTDVAMRQARHMFDGEGKTIKATQGGQFNPTKDIPRYVDLWESGRLKLEGLITHRLKLDDINEGLELVRAGLAGRVLIEMT